MKMFSGFFKEIAEQGERLFLWAPVLLGAGIGLYFSLEQEPPLWLGTAGFLSLFAPAMLFRKRRAFFIVFFGLSLVTAGFATAQIRTALVAAPVLKKKMAPVMLSGRVMDISQQPKGGRLLLEDVKIDRLAAQETPQRVRLSFRGDVEWPQAGDEIRILAGLSPPSPPVAPGSYDFQRHAWYGRIGAFGYPLGKIEITHVGKPGAENFFENLRQKIDARIRAHIGEGSAAGIASALLTGERAGISEDDLESMRRSGLFHLLSISGTHMAILAGFVFFLIRGGLCLSERIALNWPVKKIAALATFPVIFFYLILVGAPVPAQRSVIMTSVVLLAIVADRLAFNMRIVALSAFLILLFLPENLVSPSFQLSFAAVAALIACYESLRSHHFFGHDSFALRFLSYFAGIALTSLVASAATAPFVLYHFQNVSFFWGVLANMAAVPLTAFIIMPAGFIACLMMPFGLDAWLLGISAFGIDKMLDVAHFTGGFESSLFLFKAWPLAALVLITLGGLVLTLWSGRWRFSGMIFIATGALIALSAPVPDIFVSGDAKLFAVRGQDGLHLSSRRSGKFMAENWVHMIGNEEAAGYWPAEEIGLFCDSQSCIYQDSIAFVRDPLALEEDCRRADIIISAAPVKIPCQAKTVIDRYDLWRDGTHTIYLGDPVKIRSVNGYRGQRPWVY